MNFFVKMNRWSFQKLPYERVVIEDLNDYDNYFECPPEQLDELIQKLQELRKTITTA